MSNQRIIMIYVAAFLAVFCQATLSGCRDWLGAQVDLLPALMVYAALYTGLVNLGVFAVVAGLWFDCLSANPLGISILPLYVVGIVIFLQRDVILRESAFAQVVIGALASAAAPLLAVLMMLSAAMPLVLSWGSLWQWVVMTVGGAAATPVIFVLFERFDHLFGYKLKTEPSFRPDREIRRSR